MEDATEGACSICSEHVAADAGGTMSRGVCSLNGALIFHTVCVEKYLKSRGRERAGGRDVLKYGLYPCPEAGGCRGQMSASRITAVHLKDESKKKVRVARRAQRRRC